MCIAASGSHADGTNGSVPIAPHPGGAGALVREAAAAVSVSESRNLKANKVLLEQRETASEYQV